MDNVISVNSVIEWFKVQNREAGLSRILWIDEKRTCVAVYFLTGRPAFPILMEYAEIVSAIESLEAAISPFDPYAAPILEDAEISEKQLRIRDKNWEIIRNIVVNEPEIFFDEKRGSMVRETVDKTGTQKKYIYKYLKRYWQSGMCKNALLPDFRNCGGLNKEKSSSNVKRGRPPNGCKDDPEKTGINITEVDKTLIRVAIDKYYDTSDRNSIQRAYDMMIDKHYKIGSKVEDGVELPIIAPSGKCPSLDQFYYWFKKFLNPEKSIKARIGERSYNLGGRPVLNKSTHFAFGPGYIYQIDSTIADIYLLSMFLQTLIIGRPVLYFVVDVFSALVVGFYMGLEGPSWMGAALALFITAMNKVELCTQFGINIQPGIWPVDMFSQKIVADRAELLSKNSDNLLHNFNMRVTNTPSWRADFKGLVEQEFHRANVSTINWIPGAVKGRLRQRGEKDHRLDATLTLPEFTEVLIRMIIKYNNSHFLEDYPLLPEMIADGVKPVPIELWNWGMKNRTGYLQHRSEQQVMLGLMPTDRATVSAEGIKFKGLYYTCDRAIKEGWYVNARNKGSWKWKGYYNPRKLDKIYLLPNQEKEPIECKLLEKSQMYSEYYLEDLLEQNAIKGQMKLEHKDIERQADAEQRAHIAAIIKRGQDRKKQVMSNLPTNRQRTLSIRENRKNEKAILAEQEAFNPTADSPPLIGWSGESNDNFDETFVTDQSSSKRERTLNMLKNLRKGGSTENG